MFSKQVITARKRSLRRLCFYRWLSVHGGVCGCGGVCMVTGDMHGCGGHAWLCVCVGGGGLCMVVEGHVWLLGGIENTQGRPVPSAPSWICPGVGLTPGPCTETSLNRMTDTTESITFLQLHWRVLEKFFSPLTNRKSLTRFRSIALHLS